MQHLGKFVACLLVLGLAFQWCYTREVEVEGTYTGPENPDRPSISINSIGRVETKKPEQFGGTCFLLEHGSGVALVSAYHVLAGVSPGSQVTMVSKIPKLAQTSEEPLYLPYRGRLRSGSPLTESKTRGDLTGYRVESLHEMAEALKLTAEPPKVNQPIWVIQLTGPDRSPEGTQAIKGTVHKHSNHLLMIKMIENAPGRWSSGAPVVNAEGEVVGVNVGYAYNPTGSYRMAVPTASLEYLISQ